MTSNIIRQIHKSCETFGVGGREEKMKDEKKEEEEGEEEIAAVKVTREQGSSTHAL